MDAEGYFAVVGAALVGALTASPRGTTDADPDTFVAALLGKAAMLGQATAVSAAIAACDPSRDTARRIASVTMKAGGGLEKLVEARLKLCQSRADQQALLWEWAALYWTSPQLRFLLGHKFILVRVYDGVFLETVMAVIGAATAWQAAHHLGASDSGGGAGGGNSSSSGGIKATGGDSGGIVEVLLSVIAVWGDGSALRSCPHDQILYLSKAIVYGLAYMPEAVAVAHGPKIVQRIVSAIQRFLESSVAATRHLGYAHHFPCNVPIGSPPPHSL
jgi:hypothetical protein